MLGTFLKIIGALKLCELTKFVFSRRSQRSLSGKILARKFWILLLLLLFYAGMDQRRQTKNTAKLCRSKVVVVYAGRHINILVTIAHYSGAPLRGAR